jgi:hypothetical protein
MLYHRTEKCGADRAERRLYSRRQSLQMVGVNAA